MQVFRPTTTSPISAPSPSAQNPCYEPNSGTLLFTEFTAGYNNPNNTGSAGLFTTPSAGGAAKEIEFHLGQSAANLPGTCYSARATGGPRIAYALDLPDTDNIWTALPGGLNDSEHQVTCYAAASGFSAEEPSWSSDGRTIVYERDDGNHVGTIWTVPANNSCATGFHPTEIVPAPAGRCPGQSPPAGLDLHEPNWSPNGARIVFQSGANESAEKVNLYTVSPNGCGLTQITNDGTSDTDASWSPASTQLVYSTDRQAPTGIANLFVVPATKDATPRRLTSQCYYDGAPSWSPDGRWISFETWPVRFAGGDHDTAIWRISAVAHPGAPSC
jgi:TolB protein